MQYSGRPEPLMKLFEGFLVNSIQDLHKKQVCHYVVYPKLSCTSLRYFTAVVLLSFPEKNMALVFYSCMKMPLFLILHFVSSLPPQIPVCQTL